VLIQAMWGRAQREATRLGTQFRARSD